MSQVSLQPTKDIRFYDFGPFRVDAVNRLLLQRAEIVPLTSKVFDVLLAFVSNSGRMLDKEDLMKQVWPTSFVEEGNLTRNISTLRKALRESPHDHQYIVTIPGRGYRFVAKVTEVNDEGSTLVAEEPKSGSSTRKAQRWLWKSTLYIRFSSKRDDERPTPALVVEERSLTWISIEARRRAAKH